MMWYYKYKINIFFLKKGTADLILPMIEKVKSVTIITQHCSNVFAINTKYVYVVNKMGS